MTKPCAHCSGELKYLKTEKIQLGQTGWLLGDLPNLFAGAMSLQIYLCNTCHKVEFFADTEKDNSHELKQITCKKCGHTYDFDYPKCPQCKEKTKYETL